jgi:hypothetical protein
VILGLDLGDVLNDAGFDVVGPLATVDAALHAIGTRHRDIAIVADALATAKCAVPVAWRQFPERFAHYP